MRRLLPLVAFVLLLAPAARAEDNGLSLRLAVYNPRKGPVRLVLRVENLTSAAVMVTQSDGQTHDFVVLRNGKPVWKWSSDKLFLQAVQELIFRAGEIRAFHARWNRCDAHGTPLPPGHYVVEALIPRMGAEPLKAQPRKLVIPGAKPHPRKRSDSR